MTRLINTVRNKLPLIALIFVSIGIVFYQFLKVPKNTTFDEIEFAKLALKLDGQPYAPYNQYATGHATLYFYLILLSFKLFGTSLFALRLPSAIAGIMGTILFYQVMKKVFVKNKLLPFLAAFTFITLRWYFNFARFGFEVTFLLSLELASLLFALLYQEKNRKLYLFLSGIFAGLSYNSYQPGRIFFIIPLFIILARSIQIHHIPKKIRIQLSAVSRWRTMLELVLKPALYFLIPFFVLILPLTIYLNLHKDTRFYQQFYPDNHEMTLQEKGQFFTRNLTSTIGIFNLKGDVNGRHNYPHKPALNPILGTLFIIGLILSLKEVDKRQNQVFLIWFFISLAPTLFTYPWENPNMLRTFTVIPSVVYFISLSILKLAKLGLRHFHAKKVVYFLFVVLVGISTLYELKTYFIYQAQVFNEAFEAERDLTTYL